MSLLTNEDIPDSNCSSGSATFPAFASVRNVEKATRAHSTVAKQPLDEADIVEDLCLFRSPAGEVETRFKVRGCNGVMGIEFERRRAFRVADLTNWSGAEDC
jgi:hypothetical protein